MTSYVLLETPSHPLVAYTEGGVTSRRAVASSFNAFTPRRRVAFGLLGSAVLLGRSGKHIDEDELAALLGADVGALGGEVRRATGEALTHLAAIWPWPPLHLQEARTYLHWFSEQGHRLGFSKIASQTSSYAPRLAAEAEVLRTLPRFGWTTFTCPRVLAHGPSHLTVTGIPRGARPIPRRRLGRARALVRDFGRSTSHALEVERLSVADWFNSPRLEQFPHLRRHLMERTAEQPLPVQFAHGDFERKNMLEAGDEFHLFDWEWANHDAPRHVDSLRLLLSSRPRHHRRQPERSLRALERAFGERSVELLAALAFLSACRSPEATALCVAWERSQVDRTE